jgi:type I restriction enzyme S subunit
MIDWLQTKFLPAGWLETTIGYAYNFTRRPRSLNLGAYPKIPFVPMELVPLKGASTIRWLEKSPEEISSGTYFERGDVLLSRITPSFENGKQGIAEGLPTPFAFGSTEIIPIQARPNISDARFLFYLLLHPNLRSEIAARMEGSTGRQRVPESVVREWPIPLPPLSEQRAIAAVLSKVQEAIEVEGELVKVTRELKQAALRQLFTRGLRGEPQKETEIGLVPESWEVVRVADCILPFRFDRSQQLPASQYSATGRFPIVDQGQALIAGYCDDDSRVLHPHHPLIIFGDHTRCLKFVDFPFVLGADGTKPLIARSEWDALALFYALSAVQVESRGYNRHFKQFSEKMVSRPKDIAEQRSIAAILRTIDDKIAYHEERQRLLRELFRTLLHDLMTGRRRVAGAEAAASLEGVA